MPEGMSEFYSLAVKLPIANAVGDYINTLVDKAKKAGQTSLDQNGVVTQHPELTMMESATLNAAVAGFMRS